MTASCTRPPSVQARVRVSRCLVFSRLAAHRTRKMTTSSHLLGSFGQRFEAITYLNPESSSDATLSRPALSSTHTHAASPHRIDGLARDPLSLTPRDTTPPHTPLLFLVRPAPNPTPPPPPLLTPMTPLPSPLFPLVRDNQLGPEGAGALAAPLSRLTALTSLHVG